MVPAVYGLVMRDGELLMMRRAGSGYRDGQLSLPAGHLDGGEDAISGLARELAEEIGIHVQPRDCQLVLTMHRAAEGPADREYVDLYFQILKWRGAPVIAEPAKCSELLWVDPRHLPGDVVDYVARALTAVREGSTLALDGWDARSA